MAPRAWFSRNKEHEQDTSDGLWIKCTRCERIVFSRDLERNLKVCPHCSYHHRLTAWERVELLAEPRSFQEWDANLLSSDPLSFPDYQAKLQKDRRATGMSSAVLTGVGFIGEHRAVFGITDFRFRAGAMDSVVGERLSRAIERATDEKLPVILISGTGGGASMFEGILSLMQMTKTSVVLGRHHEAGQLSCCILTDPTMAGVYASWASLGDITLAEPGAMIGFTGARVSKQAQAHVGRRPSNYQTAEFQQDRGMVDRVVPRKELKATLEKILTWAA